MTSSSRRRPAAVVALSVYAVLLALMYAAVGIIFLSLAMEEAPPGKELARALTFAWLPKVPTRCGPRRSSSVAPCCFAAVCPFISAPIVRFVQPNSHSCRASSLTLAVSGAGRATTD